MKPLRKKALSRRTPERPRRNERSKVTTLELTKIEARLHNRLLFNVRANSSGQRIDFPIEIKGRGSPALDDEAVLAAALTWAEALVAALRFRLPQPAAPAARLKAAVTLVAPATSAPSAAP